MGFRRPASLGRRPRRGFLVLGLVTNRLDIRFTSGLPTACSDAPWSGDYTTVPLLYRSGGLVRYPLPVPAEGVGDALVLPVLDHLRVVHDLVAEVGAEQNVGEVSPAQRASGVVAELLIGVGLP